MLSRLSSYLGELEIDESRKSCGSHRSSVNGEQTEVFSQSKYENGKHGSQSNSRYSSDSEYFWFMIFPRFFYKFQYLNIFQNHKYYFLKFSQNLIYLNLFLFNSYTYSLIIQKSDFCLQHPQHEKSLFFMFQ